MKYKVIQIYECDYGCEELLPGAEPMVDVCIEAEDGTQKMLREKDSLLYSLNINEGDAVCFHDGKIEKV